MSKCSGYSLANQPLRYLSTVMYSPDNFPFMGYFYHILSQFTVGCQNLSLSWKLCYSSTFQKICRNNILSARIAVKHALPQGSNTEEATTTMIWIEGVPNRSVPKPHPSPCDAIVCLPRTVSNYRFYYVQAGCREPRPIDNIFSNVVGRRFTMLEVPVIPHDGRRAGHGMCTGVDEGHVSGVLHRPTMHC